jgi:hypothetical protein
VSSGLAAIPTKHNKVSPLAVEWQAVLGDEVCLEI